MKTVVMTLLKATLSIQWGHLISIPTVCPIAVFVSNVMAPTNETTYFIGIPVLPHSEDPTGFTGYYMWIVISKIHKVILHAYGICQRDSFLNLKAWCEFPCFLFAYQLVPGSRCFAEIRSIKNNIDCVQTRMASILFLRVLPVFLDSKNLEGATIQGFSNQSSTCSSFCFIHVICHHCILLTMKKHH